MIVITGAAGAIGASAVMAFLAAGHEVTGLDRDPAVLDLTTDPGYRGFAVDVCDEAAVRDVIAEARTHGSLRHLIGIAGGALPEEPPTQHDPVLLLPETFRASLELNLTSQFTVLRAALPWMRDDSSTDRSVTFISSWNALTGCGMPAYSAAKAGLIGMMHALAGPLGAEGIRVNVIAPGTIRTPRTERLWAHDPAHWDRLAAGSALRRTGTPDDVARSCVAVAAMLTHVTGQVLVVDGGQMISR